MIRSKARVISILLTLTILLLALPFSSVNAADVGSGIIDADGWFESAYAEWISFGGADSYNAYICAEGSESWSAIDAPLIRKYSDYYRVDAVGLKAGNYRIKIVPVLLGAEKTGDAIITDTLTVSAYDRSGYAHFNYTDGVGAYNDDGTLKPGAIVLYVTDQNKNTVSVTSKDGTTVVGIGNILNSVGKNVSGGLSNTNSDIINKLAKDGTPLVVRIIGNVTAPDGLTAYNSTNYGGSVGDNGFMARMSGGKNITIEGIGHDASMNGWGVHFICQSSDYKNGFGKNFEVRNITFKNVPEDCIGMEGQQEGSTLSAPVERCWIHHCTFYAPTISNPAESDKDGGDGACDFKRGQYFTNSYCYYIGYHKTNLVGSSDDSLQYHITYHHNYWKDCDSRGPLARQANIHMYNNIFEGQTSYCMNPRANAYIFSEYNMFYKSKNPVEVKSGAVKSYNDAFTSYTGLNDATIVTDRTTKVTSGNKYENFDTNSSLSYIPTGDYVIQESIGEMRAVVLAYAGTQKENILSPEQVNTSVIPSNRYPTSAVVLDYSKNLNKSSVPASGTYDNIVFSASKYNAGYIGLGGNGTGCDIVFYVDTAVDVTIEEYSISTNKTVLCDENGRSLLIGSGTAKNLPSGYYFIQSLTYDVGGAKYKEAGISALSIVAVDPNASTDPIPTPPPSDTDPDDNTGEGGNGSGDNNENEDNNGGGTVTDGTVITEKSETHNFTTNQKTDPEGFFSITGNTSTSKGSVTFNGETLRTCLKIESSTNISFTATTKGTLVLVFGGTTNAAGKDIKVDGKSYDIPTSQILEILLGSGSHTITKGASINLFFMAFVPEEAAPHTHKYNSEVTTKPTCTEDGVVTYSCDCGESYTETISATGHSYTGEVTTELTCTQDGVTTYSCDCGDSYTETVKATGHSYTGEVTTELTCTQDGVTTYSCDCGDSYTETILATGHDYEETRVDPTCTEDGAIYYSCGCGESYTETINAFGHSYEEIKVDPTCTENGVITYSCDCGDSYTETIDATGHSYKEAGVDHPTCTEDGTIYYSCNCGDSYTEAIEATGHSYTFKVTKEATCTENGVITYTCACSDTFTLNIDASGHNYVDGVCKNCGSKENNDAPDIPEDEDDSSPEDDSSAPKDPTDIEDENPEENLNFFQKIWRAIANFFKKLFGGNKD